MTGEPLSGVSMAMSLAVPLAPVPVLWATVQPSGAAALIRFGPVGEAVSQPCSRASFSGVSRSLKAISRILANVCSGRQVSRGSLGRAVFRSGSRREITVVVSPKVGHHERHTAIPPISRIRMLAAGLSLTSTVACISSRIVSVRPTAFSVTGAWGTISARVTATARSRLSSSRCTRSRVAAARKALNVEQKANRSWPRHSTRRPLATSRAATPSRPP